jgi:hypothetical protein
MDQVLEIVTSVVAGAFGVGAAWTALRSTVSSVAKTVSAHETTLDEHARRAYEQLQKIAEQNIAIERLTARTLVLERSDAENAHNADKLERKFDKATEWQNRMLMEIHGRLGATRKDSREFKAIERVDAESDAPAPYRPRLPTLRGDDK